MPLPPLGPDAEMPAEYWESVLNDPQVAAKPGVPIQQRRLADLAVSTYVRFSNRPFGVKRFQTIHRCGVNVAHGLALLFGIGTKALPVRDSRRGGTIFAAALS
jgi:hypothetical protein